MRPVRPRARRIEPMFRPLHDEPRFQALLVRVGLKE